MRATASRLTKAGATRLRQELDVHRFELEAQNEQLRVAQRELEAALVRYTDLFEFAPIGYLSIDAAGVIRNVNHVAGELLAATGTRIVGARFTALLSPDDVAAFEVAVGRVGVLGKSSTCELQLVREGDSPLSVRVTVAPQPREPQGILLALEDITQHNLRRDQLAATESALRESNRRKDEFLAMLSHELRNPLAAIQTSLFVLTSAGASAAATDESRDIIARQVEHLTRLVDDLLDVQRLSRGRVTLKRERLELGGLVARTLEDQFPLYDAAGVVLAVAFAPGPFWVDADAARISQALSNLLANARKFTDAGGRVEVTLARRQRWVELRVSDNGTGIAPELLATVCEPFMQGPQLPDRARGGLGLGLSVAKAYVELHGGTLAIASPGVGHGTEVTVSLPLASPAAATAEPRLAAAPRTITPLARSRRVLVIEDHPDAARALEAALTLLGLEVRLAGDGPSAFEVARQFRPEIVLCDLGLPGVDGHDVARTFRADPELDGAYLVALSGYALPADVERAMRAGFARHLAKPASLDALVRVIADAP